MLYRKILIGLAVIFIALSLLVSPVSALPEKDWDLPIPPNPHQWKLIIKTGGPCTYPNDTDSQLWYYQFKVIMPPVSYPAHIVISKYGESLPGQVWDVFFSESRGWHAGPVWEGDAPDTVTYTFTLTAGDIVVTKDVTIDFTIEDCEGIHFY